MFKVYQKYLMGEFLKKFFIIFLIFFCLIFILSVFEEIKFFEELNVGIAYPYLLTLINLPITIFEIFPFIILLTTQFLFYELSHNDELRLLKVNGLSNTKIIKILFILSIVIGIFNVLIFYNIASKLKFYYSDIKNSYSNDNKYLAMVTDSGLWIKDELDNKIYIIKSDYIKGDFLSRTFINEFDTEFELIRTIQSEKINIKDTNWVIENPIITENNITKIYEKPLNLETNFNQKKINNLFSNVSTYNVFELFNLKKDFDKFGYSSNEIKIHLLKLFSTPIFYSVLTVLSVIVILIFNNRSIFFNIIIGIFMSVMIYYFTFIFASLGNNGKIPVILSIFFPIIIISLLCAIGLITINEK